MDLHPPEAAHCPEQNTRDGVSSQQLTHSRRHIFVKQTQHRPWRPRIDFDLHFSDAAWLKKVAGKQVRLICFYERSFTPALPASVACLVQITCSSLIAPRDTLVLRNSILCVICRSRTTYKTLQLALHYLALVRLWIQSSIKESKQPSHPSMGGTFFCARRIFITALMLAWKYLEDHSYTATTWAKISGLCVGDITIHERLFLEMIDYKLYLGNQKFVEWARVVEGSVKNFLLPNIEHSSLYWHCNLNKIYGIGWPATSP